jgi:hypothetical protein
MFAFTLLASFTASADSDPVEAYIAQVPTYGVKNEVVETGWYRIDENPWWNPLDPTDAVRARALTEMKTKLRRENKKEIERNITWQRIDKCERAVDYQKYYERRESSSSSGYSSVSLVPWAYAASSGYSDSYYFYEKSIREAYCAESGTYLKATIRLSTKLSDASPELKRYYVLQHIQNTTKDLATAMNSFVTGLSEIEKSPVISYSRYKKFGISDGTEIQTWMSFYISKMQLGLDYIKLVDALNFGLEAKSATSNLKTQILTAMRKLAQFEAPGVYVAIVDYGSQGWKPAASFLYDQGQLRELATAHGLTINVSAGTTIRNRSLVENRAFMSELARQLQCDSIYDRIKTSNSSMEVIKQGTDFSAELAQVRKNCTGRYTAKPWYYNGWSYSTRLNNALAAVSSMTNIGCYPVAAADNNSNSYLQITYVCPLSASFTAAN